MPESRPGTTPEDVLRRAFDAYNRQDVDAMLAMVSDGVVWSADAGPLRKDQLRAFWVEQWATTRTHDKVTQVEQVADTEFLVGLDQMVRSIDGSIISTGSFRYGFVVEAGLITALKAREPVELP